MLSLVLGTRRQQACSKQSGRSLISTCWPASESLMPGSWIVSAVRGDDGAYDADHQVVVLPSMVALVRELYVLLDAGGYNAGTGSFHLSYIM